MVLGKGWRSKGKRGRKRLVGGTNGTVWDDLERFWDGFGTNLGFWNAVFGVKMRVWDEMGRFGTVLGMFKPSHLEYLVVSCLYISF